MEQKNLEANPTEESERTAIKPRRAKKKSTMLKTVELSNFVVNNEIRAAAGMRKVNIKQPMLFSQPIVQNTSEENTHKGVRREKKPTTLKKKILEAREHDGKPPCSTNGDISFSPTPLDECVVELLKKLKKQANAAHKANPVKVELSNFVVNNEIRAAAGMRKVNNRAPMFFSQPVVQRKEENTHKGIRREKKPTTLKKVSSGVFSQ
ncbi:unnamed protein product [Strongylus vulgaris]|uniref:Uncharacterized protein n=1 Tax=Strongylus vulgaris TaxID=40348 RepID=A0A3P7JJ48_STRVU|nr:unnamed protein product [Strongylus vulgaris]